MLATEDDFITASASISVLALELPPPSGAVVCDNGPEHVGERLLVDPLALTDRHASCRLVLVTCGNDAVRIGRDRIVDEDVDVVLGREQGADVAIQNEIRAVSALDGLRDLWIRGVNQSAYLATDRLLPIRKGADVRVDPWVRCERHLGHDSRTNTRLRRDRWVESIEQFGIVRRLHAFEISGARARYGEDAGNRGSACGGCGHVDRLST